MLNKKAQLPIQKTLLILIFTTIILISFLIILIPSKNVEIDDKKIKTQIINKKLLSCFSEEFNIIEIDKYKQENLDYCLKNLDNVLVKINLNEGTYTYLNNAKEDFENKAQIGCKVDKSNLLCTKNQFPTIVKFNENYEIQTLEVVSIIY